jgi:hypothetical protein
MAPGCGTAATLKWRVLQYELAISQAPLGHYHGGVINTQFLSCPTCRGRDVTPVNGIELQVLCPHDEHPISNARVYCCQKLHYFALFDNTPQNTQRPGNC